MPFEVWITHADESPHRLWFASDVEASAMGPHMQDATFERADWPALKAKLPFGQVCARVCAIVAPVPSF